MDKTLTHAEMLAIIEENGGRQENILNILLALQSASEEGYVDSGMIAVVADELGMSETKVFEIASFYSMIKTGMHARHVFEVCNSTPCYYTKSDEVTGWLESALGIKIGEVSADGMFSYCYTPCVGACDIGPVIKVKDTVYGNLTKKNVIELIRALRDGIRDQ